MQRGFSIIELVIYSAITSMIVLALTSVVYSGNKAVTNRTVIDDVHHAGIEIVRSIERDVRESSAITTPAKGVSTNTLSLTLSGNTVTYAISSGELVRTESGTPKTLTVDGVEIESLSISSLAPSASPAAISFAFVLSHEDNQGEGLMFSGSQSTYYE